MVCKNIYILDELSIRPYEYVIYIPLTFGLCDQDIYNVIKSEYISNINNFI